jgi:hypothetical protein
VRVDGRQPPARDDSPQREPGAPPKHGLPKGGGAIAAASLVPPSFCGGRRARPDGQTLPGDAPRHWLLLPWSRPLSRGGRPPPPRGKESRGDDLEFVLPASQGLIHVRLRMRPTARECGAARGRRCVGRAAELTRMPEGEVMSKTALSFYLDDTSPYGRPTGTFERFLDFVSAEGIAGESSVILGMGWKEFGLLSRPATEIQKQYIEQLQRGFGCGIDAHMELMTHGSLFDFATHRVPEGAPHEGVWLHEPEVPVAASPRSGGRLHAGQRHGRVGTTPAAGPDCRGARRRSHLGRHAGAGRGTSPDYA